MSSDISMKIAVLLTCFNRVDKTLECLDNLYANDLTDILMSVYLVDDGCTDGTAKAVAEKFPKVNVIETDGGLFWNKGMHLAFSKAMVRGYDAYMMLNDDTMLYKDTLKKMHHTFNQLKRDNKGECIVVGTTKDNHNNISYGGLIRPKPSKHFSFKITSPDYSKPTECLTMNGNCVFIPSAIVKVIGNLDPIFSHAMGDIDYGLRARKAGFRIFVAPGFIGTCENNPTEGTFNDKSMHPYKRFRLLINTKNLPLRSWATLTFRHGGVKAPLYFLWPYFKVWLPR